MYEEKSYGRPANYRIRMFQKFQNFADSSFSKRKEYTQTAEITLATDSDLCLMSQNVSC